MNMSALTRNAAEEMAENLTMSYSGFVNHRLITEGCKHEYIWSKIDPAMDPSILNDAVLNVTITIMIIILMLILMAKIITEVDIYFPEQ